MDFFCGFLSLRYKTFFNVLCACKKVQIQNSELIVIEKGGVDPTHIVNNNTNNVGGVNIPFGNAGNNEKYINNKHFDEINTPTKVTEFNPEDAYGNDFELKDITRKKSLVHNKIIWGIGAGVVLILAIFLIVYFAIHGGKKQEINETVDPRNGQVGGNQADNNEID